MGLGDYYPRPMLLKTSQRGVLPLERSWWGAVWETLVQTYFEPQSEDDLHAINTMAHGGGLLRLVALCAKHAQLADSVKQAAIDSARQSFFPHIDEYMGTLEMMDRYFHT